MLKATRLSSNLLAQVANPSTVSTVSLNHRAHSREVFSKLRTVNVERVLSDFVENQDNARLTSEAIDETKPIIRIMLLVTPPPIQDE